jgi:hypothetical protein
MSEALVPPKPSACTLISICRDPEAVLLSAACPIAIRVSQSKLAASLLTAAGFISAGGDDGSLKLSMLHPRLMGDERVDQQKP